MQIWSRKILPILAAATMSLLLAACGGSEGDPKTGARDTGGEPVAATPSTTPPAQQSPGTSTATAVSLTGTPATSVRVGQAYTFTPRTSTSSTGFAYTVANKPGWATFDTVTGRLYGTPQADHAGTYRGITITASNGLVTAALPAFDIQVVPSAVTTGGYASITWQTPQQYDDGTALTDLGGYRIYHGTSADALTNVIDIPNAQATSYTVNNLNLGTHYFSLTAYNAAGVESDRSAVFSKSVM